MHAYNITKWEVSREHLVICRKVYGRSSPPIIFWYIFRHEAVKSNERAKIVYCYGHGKPMEKSNKNVSFLTI